MMQAKGEEIIGFPKNKKLFGLVSPSIYGILVCTGLDAKGEPMAPGQ